MLHFQTADVVFVRSRGTAPGEEPERRPSEQSSAGQQKFTPL
jgi:hypothetical protein